MSDAWRGGHFASGDDDYIIAASRFGDAYRPA